MLGILKCYRFVLFVRLCRNMSFNFCGKKEFIAIKFNYMDVVC